jgi:hypothetical protein
MPHMYAKTVGGKSWHIVSPVDVLQSLCGRRLIGPDRDSLPAGKSCESCLRIAERAAH